MATPLFTQENEIPGTWYIWTHVSLGGYCSTQHCLWTLSIDNSSFSILLLMCIKHKIKRQIILHLQANL